MFLLGTPQVTLNLDWYEWVIIFGAIGTFLLIRYMVKKRKEAQAAKDFEF